MLNIDDNGERRLRTIIREEIANAFIPYQLELKALHDDIAENRRHIDDHEKFRFAHGWDHEMITTNQTLLNEWAIWRRNVDRWRWTQAGAIAFIAAEVPIVVALFVALFHR